MTYFDDLFTPENKFIIPATIHLNPDEQLRLRKFLNLHYLGDEDANELVDGEFVPKYPEKETEEFKNAATNVFKDYRVHLCLTFDTNGIPTFEIAKE